MKFTILKFGKLKNKNIENEFLEIEKRIKNLQIVTLKDCREKDIKKIKDFEEKEIITFLEKNSNKKDFYKILLNEFGKNFETKEFYNFILKNKNQNLKDEILFVISGPYGFNEKLKTKFDLTLSLSKLTFTHEVAFLLLVDLIYRINCFEKNIDYTK